ncbi:MAG TPA: VOC family protein [Candidatus Saccharimonadales bacterium]|nr:VOC family protein [Candidatus Saccharimonadales bacterium]
MSKSVFINLPTQNVAAAREFYAKLGLTINEEYSNEQNAFVIVDENIQLILASHDFFKQNDPRDIADTSKTTEVSIAIQVESREDVDRLFNAAIAAGGKQAGETIEEVEIGMYSRGLTDLDGHRFDLLSMTLPAAS